MTDTSKEQDAYRVMYLQNWTFTLHGRGNKEQDLRLLSVCDHIVQNAHKCRLNGVNKCQTAKLTNDGTGHPPMPILSAQRCLFAALKKAGHGAHNRRSLALTKAGSQGFAVDGPWRSQMWVSLRLTVSLPDRTCFEPSPYPSVSLSTTHPIF